MANTRSWKTFYRRSWRRRAADIFEWNSEETKRIFGEIIASISKHSTCNLPACWCCSCFSSWNFPIILASRKISTVTAGCSVIVKPDIITPGSVMEIVDICKEAGVPSGVVNLLSGDPAGI